MVRKAKQTPIAVNENDTKHCFCCGKEKKDISSNFYQNINSKINNKFGLCKLCIKEIISYEDLSTVDYVLRVLDRPFIKEIWKEANKSSDDTWGAYIRPISSLPQYKDLRYKDSDMFKTTKSNITISNDEYAYSEIDIKECELFWGKGFTGSDYEYLQREFVQWTTRYKCDEYAEEVLYKEICLQTLSIRKDREKNNDVTKKVEALQKLMSSANVKPADTKAINSGENINALGIWIRDIEKYRPAEYFQDKKIYDDYDEFNSYMQRFILRPLKNLLTGTREFDNEFNIENKQSGDIDG